MAKKIKKIIVDRNLCIGAASCVVVAPEVFEMDDENKAVILLKNGKKRSEETTKEELMTNLDDETILLAAQSCPTQAIFLEDEDGNIIYP
jgi:ferredoxin